MMTNNEAPDYKEAVTLMQDSIVACNEARELIEKFRKTHPYLIAPNVLGLMEDSLKENVHTMDRVLRQRYGLGGQS